MLGLVLTLFFIGVVSGYLARLLVAGPDPMSFWTTVGLGVAGSFVGGTLYALVVAHQFVLAPGPILLAIPGSVVALLIYRRVKYGTIMPPRGGLRRPPR